MRVVVRRWCDGDCWRFRRNMPSVQLHSGKTSTATSPTIGSRGAYCDSLSNTFNTCGTNSLMHRQDTPPLCRSHDVPFTTSLKALAVAKVGLWKKKINPALLRDRYRYRARRRMRGAGLSLRLYTHQIFELYDTDDARCASKDAAVRCGTRGVACRSTPLIDPDK